MIDWTMEIHGACRKFEDVPDGATIESINGRVVVGQCERCGKYICEPHCALNGGDCDICEKCARNINEETIGGKK